MIFSMALFKMIKWTERNRDAIEPRITCALLFFPINLFYFFLLKQNKTNLQTIAFYMHFFLKNCCSIFKIGVVWMSASGVVPEFQNLYFFHCPIFFYMCSLFFFSPFKVVTPFPIHSTRLLKFVLFLTQLYKVLSIWYSILFSVNGSIRRNKLNMSR